MFGAARFESGNFPTIDGEGRLCPTAHRFAHQFFCDARLVSDFPDMINFKAAYAESVINLFGIERVREEFLDFDATILRSKYLSRSWPPAGFLQDALLRKH